MPDIRTLLAACLLPVAAWLGGCTSSYHGPPPVEDFSTRITDNRLKFFTYTWRFRPPTEETVPAGTPGWAAPGDMEGMIRRDLGQVSADVFTEFRERMHERLEASGYCREGYIELSRSYWPGEFRIRGECRDLASEADRERFAGAQAESGPPSPATEAGSSSP